MLEKKIFFKLYINTVCFRYMPLHGIMKIIIKMTYNNMKESNVKGG